MFIYFNGKKFNASGLIAALVLGGVFFDSVPALLVGVYMTLAGVANKD